MSMIPPVIHVIENKLMALGRLSKEDHDKGIVDIAKTFSITEAQVQKIYSDLSKKMTGGY
jgi:hypothetical protein